MGVDLQTIQNDSPGAFEFVRGAYAGAVLTFPDESTNQERFISIQATIPAPSAIERTVDYAVARYDALLRRLAD